MNWPAFIGKLSNKQKTFLVIGFLVIVVLSACAENVAEQNESGESGLAESTSEAARSTAEEIVMAAPRDLAPGKEDPYFTSSILYVWEPLIGVNEEGKPEPLLVQSWEISEDAKLWTFSLKQGVEFHDGHPLNADAVLQNFDRLQQISPAGSPFYSYDFDHIYPGCNKLKK